MTMSSVPPDNNTTGTPNRDPRRILFANAKGGCGKSTLATNLASTYVQAGIPTALIDHDPQGSASQWLKRRPDSVNAIHGIEAFRKDSAGTTGNWFMRMPREITRVIIDTPAGLHGAELQLQVQSADVIIVPVLPSPIDIHSATRFIGSILLSSEYRQRLHQKQILVLANRTRKNTRVLEKLDLFLNSLKLPRVGDIRDTQQYVHCSETGTGMIDIPGARFEADRAQWVDIMQWLENYFREPPNFLINNKDKDCRQIGEQVYTVR